MKKDVLAMALQDFHMRLFIAEKPSVAKAIAAELGNATRANGYLQCGADRVTWCFGHILEMAMPEHYGAQYAKWRAEDLPIIPEHWALLPKPDAKAQLAIIGRLLKEATAVINAGDPDREGQLLVDEVLEHFRSKLPTKRFWVSAQDSISIRRGLAGLKDNCQYRGFRDAALARQRADWLIGMNCSRAYTLRAQRGGAQKTVLTVGRVQTPTLALVVARDREIEAFQSSPYYKIYVDLRHANGDFRAVWQARPKQQGLDAEGRLTDPHLAASVVTAALGARGCITEYKVEPRAEPHPRAFALSDITLVASNKFGYSAEDTLRICQSLYETHKLTSYPRTDCDYLPESQFLDAPQVLAALTKINPHMSDLIAGANPSLKSKTWDDSKITAHHGIIPTAHVSDLSSLNQQERNLYDLIVRAYIAQFYPVHQYLSTAVQARFDLEYFVASGRTVTHPGWRAVYGGAGDDAARDDPAEGTEQALPKMAQADLVNCLHAESKSLKTKPPARFTEGTLQKAMENIHRFVTDLEQKKLLREGDGIGTSATRASIISELRRRTFLEAQGKQLISTPLGRGLIDALPEAVKSPSLTALYERMLKDVEAGKASVEAFLDKQAAFVREHVGIANDGMATLAGAGQPDCPICQKGSLRRIARKDGSGHFLGCSRFAEGCKAAFDDVAGKPAVGASAGKSTTSPTTHAFACPSCKAGTLRKIKGSKGTFWGCGRFREGCKSTFNDLKGRPEIRST